MAQETNKPNETLKLFKDFTKVLVLEGRDKLADGLYNVAEKVDITEQQERFCKTFRADLDKKRQEKELNNAKVVPSTK